MGMRTRSARAIATAALAGAVAASTSLASTPFFTGLGDLDGGEFFSCARAVSGDGSIVFGTATSADGQRVYRWTLAQGMVDLGFSGFATGASADGTVAVGGGEIQGPGLHEAFRWTDDAGVVGLGDFTNGDYLSAAYIAHVPTPATLLPLAAAPLTLLLRSRAR